MSTRLPLAPLPLSQFVAAPGLTPSPPKKHSRLARLVRPTLGMADPSTLLPSPFAQPAASTSTGPSSGPLTTLYDRPPSVRRVEQSPRTARTRRPSLIDQEEAQEHEPDAPTIATPPRRLLDLFVQSAEKEGKSPRRRRAESIASSPAPLFNASARADEAPVAPNDSPAFEFFYDEGVDDAPCSTTATTGDAALRAGLEPSDDGSEGDASTSSKENARPAPRHFRSASLLSLSMAPPDVAMTTTTQSAPPSLPTSANTSPARPPALVLPSRSTTTMPLARSDEMPKTPDQPGSPAYPGTSPTGFPFLAESEAHAFAESGTSSFETTRTSDPTACEGPPLLGEDGPTMEGGIDLCAKKRSSTGGDVEGTTKRAKVA
ncbi:hypothetical protein JCM10212_003381 [Sporobolomyces blumeae]